MFTVSLMKILQFCEKKENADADFLRDAFRIYFYCIYLSGNLEHNALKV